MQNPPCSINTLYLISDTGGINNFNSSLGHLVIDEEARDSSPMPNDSTGLLLGR